MTEPGPSLELILAQQANAAMKAGADPAATTALLQKMVSHVRANPELAQQGSLALSHGADPSAVSNTVFQQMQSAGVPHPKLGHAAGMLSGAAQGATFGFADEALGGIDALNSVLPKVLGGEGAPVAKMGEKYRATRDKIRASDMEYACENPLKYGGAALAGGLATSLGSGGAKLLKQAPSLTQKLLSAIDQGAVAGAASGFGSAEGSPGEQADNAARGAMIGAPTAAALTGAGSLVGSTGKYAMNRLNLRPKEPLTIAGIRVPINTVKEEGAARVTRALAAANKTPDDAAAIAAANRMGAKKPQTLMEIGGQPVAREARTARAASPAAGQKIDAMLEGRTAGAPDRAIQDALETSGLQRRSSAFQTTKQLVKQRSADAENAFGATFKDETPIDDPRLDEVFDTPAGQEGWKRALRTMRNKRIKVPTTDSPSPPPGVSPDDWDNMVRLAKEQGMALPGGKQRITPTIRQLHFFKLALDDLKRPGIARGEGSGGLGYNEGLSVGDVQRDLLTVMREHSPSYAEDAKQYAGTSALKNANEVGAKLFSMKPEEAADEMGNLGSAAEKEVFRRAGMDALADRLENGPSDVEKGVSKPRDQRRIRLLFPEGQPGNAAFQQFKDRIRKEAEMVGNQKYVSGGSQTADKLMDLADMLGVSPLAKAVTGHPVGAATAAVRGALKLRAKSYGSALGEATEPYLTAGGGGDLNELQQAIQKLREMNAPKAVRPAVTPRALAAAAGLLPTSPDQ